MFLFGKKADFAHVAASLIEESDDAVLFLNDNYDIGYFNRGAERMFGYKADMTFRDSFETLLPERFQHDHKTLIEDIAMAPGATGEGARIRTRQIFGKRQNGDEFAASLTVYKVDSGMHKFAVVMKDISHDKQTEEELIKLVTTDPLTRVCNRREFITMTEREALRANRYGRPLSLILLDLDKFKDINETHGYAAGDKVLQRVATLCRNMLRNVDVFGRWGGEEFAALLPETDIEGAKVIAERLRKSMEETVVTFNDEKLKFTLSAGITVFKTGETMIDVPLQRAETALEQAKREGRNRIAVYNLV